MRNQSATRLFYTIFADVIEDYNMRRYCVVVMATTCQHYTEHLASCLRLVYIVLLQMSEMSAMNKKIIKTRTETISKQIEHC